MEILIPLLPIIINALTELVKYFASRNMPPGSAPGATTSPLIAPVAAVTLGTLGGGIADGMDWIHVFGDGLDWMLGTAAGLIAIAYNQIWKIFRNAGSVRTLTKGWVHRRRGDSDATRK